MKKVLVMILALALTPTLFAGTNPPIAGAQSRPKKHLYIGMATSTTECVVGIALSKNPYTAAAIGLPILIGGNIIATKIYNNHPKWAAFIQTASGLGCLAGALTRHAPKPAKPAVNPPSSGNPPSGTNPPPSGGNPPPSGGNPPPSGGNPPPSGGNPPPTGGNPPPTTPPPSGGNPPATGGGNPPPPSGNPPPTGPCTVHGGTDCGFGNGGINPSPNPKPPVTPPGNPHTHGRLWEGFGNYIAPILF